MTSAQSRRDLTYDAYLALERDTGARYEFLDGPATAMSGGTPRHSAIKVNVHGWLRKIPVSYAWIDTRTGTVPSRDAPRPDRSRDAPRPDRSRLTGGRPGRGH